jgi:hypothetical protein
MIATRMFCQSSTVTPNYGFASNSSHSHRALARCQAGALIENRFNGFPAFQWKPLKRFLNNSGLFFTGLKPGVNEKNF